MSITRITEFYAMPKKLNQLSLEFTDNILPKVRNAPGLISAEAFTSTEGQERVVIIETWDNVESHQAAAKMVEPADFQRVMGMLKGKPVGKYYKKTEY